MIEIISCKDGKLVLHNDGGEKFASNEPHELGAFLIKCGGCADTVMASSSFHFATEYGFVDQFDAEWLWKKTVEYA